MSRNWSIVQAKGLKYWSTPTFIPTLPKMEVVGGSRAVFLLTTSTKPFFGAVDFFGLWIFSWNPFTGHPTTAGYPQ
jgi:hypothetical protein